MKQAYTSLKRSIDVAGSVVGLAIASPLLLVVGAAVRLDSKGPALFRSPRVGLHGKTFDLYKLRTMRVHEPGSAAQVTAGGDARITRVGRILRKTKLDELPQLINVLRGDVSLVGPRPEAPKYVEMYPREYERILSVKPGLSDRATLEFVGEEEILAGSEDPEKTYVEEIMPRKLAHYLRYVDNQSTIEDLAIIVETIGQVASRTSQSLRGKL